MEKKRMEGKIRFPVTAGQCLEEVLEEVGFPMDSDVFRDVCESDRAFSMGLPDSYILSGDKVFKISDKEAGQAGVGKMLDGTPVEFFTPKVQSGKFGWAYDIKPIPQKKGKK